MYGEILKATGKMASGKGENWVEMLENTKINDDEFILVWNEEKQAYDKYDNHSLYQYYEDKNQETTMKAYHQEQKDKSIKKIAQ